MAAFFFVPILGPSARIHQNFVIMRKKISIIRVRIFHDPLEPMNWSRGYKRIFMLNSAEHNIFLLIPVKMPTMIFFLLKNVKMPTINI